MVIRWLIRIQPLFVLLVTLWIGWLLHHQWQALRYQRWQLHGSWLILAALLILASWGMEVGIWRGLIGLLGGWLSYRAAWRIWFLSAIVRYVPGNVWQPLSMTLYCQRWNISPEITVTSVALYQLLTLLAVGPIAVLYFPLSHNWGPLTPLLNQLPGWLILLMLLPVGCFLIRPLWLFGLINWALGKIGRRPLAATLSGRQITLFLIAATVNWLLWGAAFAALTFALSDFNSSTMRQLAPHLISIYVIAYAIGFLSLITPSGFGVREGALYLLLVPFIDGGVVTIVALAMRMWTTLGEVFLAGLSALDERHATNQRSVQNAAGADLKRVNA